MTLKVDKFVSNETGHVVNVKCYDNPYTADRYTIIFTGYDYRDYGYNNRYALAASSTPFHPQGIGMHVECHEDANIGKRIPFSELPEDVQKFVMQDIG